MTLCFECHGGHLTGEVAEGRSDAASQGPPVSPSVLPFPLAIPLATRLPQKHDVVSYMRLVRKEYVRKVHSAFVSHRRVLDAVVTWHGQFCEG